MEMSEVLKRRNERMQARMPYSEIERLYQQELREVPFDRKDLEPKKFDPDN